MPCGKLHNGVIDPRSGMGVVRHSVGVLLHRSTPSDLVIGVPPHDPGIIPLLCADLCSHPTAVSLEVGMEHVREAAAEFHIVQKIGFIVRLAPGERLAHLDHTGTGEATAHKTLRRGIPCGNRVEIPFEKPAGDVIQHCFSWRILYHLSAHSPSNVKNRLCIEELSRHPDSPHGASRLPLRGERPPHTEGFSSPHRASDLVCTGGDSALRGAAIVPCGGLRSPQYGGSP